jgi:hypothetical protein
MILDSYSSVTERAEHCKSKSLGFRFTGIILRFLDTVVLDGDPRILTRGVVDGLCGAGGNTDRFGCLFDTMPIIKVSII